MFGHSLFVAGHHQVDITLQSFNMGQGCLPGADMGQSNDGAAARIENLLQVFYAFKGAVQCG